MALSNALELPINPMFIRIVLSLLAVAVVYGLSTMMVFVLDRLADRFSARRFLFKRLQPIPKIGGYALAAFIVIRMFSPQQTSLYAIIGSAALAIGIAAQDLLKDIIGGIVVLSDTSFQIGDRIRVGDCYGEVIHIGLLSTKIETPDDSLITIHNAVLLQSGVSNTNAGAIDCQVTAHLYLPPNVDIVAIETIAREAVMTSKMAHLDKPFTVLIQDELIETRLIHLEIRAYVFDTRYEEMFATDLTNRIKKTLYDRALIPADLGPYADVFREIRQDKLSKRIDAALAENYMKLGMRFAHRRSRSANGR